MSTYQRESSVVFCKTKEAFGGLSNMAGGFPLRFEGHDYPTSEHLYQCLRFPQFPSLQASIRAIRAPIGAKMHTKPYRATHCRKDWDLVCLNVMRFCLRLKLRSYEMTFGRLLRESQGKPIVEESRKNCADMWSARALKDDPNTLVGENHLGILLMELRDEFLSSEPGERISLPDTGFLLAPESSVTA